MKEGKFMTRHFFVMSRVLLLWPSCRACAKNSNLLRGTGVHMKRQVLGHFSNHIMYICHDVLVKSDSCSTCTRDQMYLLGLHLLQDISGECALIYFEWLVS
eukprot:c24376_g2_i3 orf=406-708(+)